jgi:hypothetical protein
VPCRFFGFLLLQKVLVLYLDTERKGNALALNGEPNSCAQSDWEEDGSSGVLENHCWQSDGGDVGRHCCGLLLR